MFSDRTFETILDRMLAQATADFPELDTREGSLLYSALAPAAVELNALYLALGTALEMSYADTASREYLIRRCFERGIVPREATCAVIEAAFTPGGISIPVGTRFRAGGAVYAVSGESPDGALRLTCESPGTAGNVSGGALVPVSFVEGLQTAAVRNLVIPGQDVEGTEPLRRRYLESYAAQAFGGNIADYRQKVRAIDGVGGVRVFPAPDGPGTVGIGIIGADLAPPSAALLDTVQTLLDPREETGNGLGLAPIGHRVTVSGVTTYPVTVAATLTLEAGAAIQGISPLAEAALEEYLLLLKAAWDDGEPLVVRISRVDTYLLDIPGVLDVSGTTLNLFARNLTLPEMKIPQLERVTIREEAAFG